jgi:glycosyltransferase involved in cell wall biosynthesis
VISLTFLVLTYNHERFIEDTLNSIRRSAGHNYKIIVLDDGSTDNTVKCVESYSLLDSEIELICQGNTNEIALNTIRLIEASKTKYVYLISGDDLVDHRFDLKLAADTLGSDETIKLVIQQGIVFGARTNPELVYTAKLLKILESQQSSIVIQKHLHKRVSRIFLQGVIAETKFLADSLQKNPSELIEDYGMIMRLFEQMEKSGFQFRFVNTPSWNYRIHRENLHKNQIRQFSNTINVVKAHVPEKHYKYFKWDIPLVDSIEELQIVLNVVRDNFGLAIQIKIVALTILRFLSNRASFKTLHGRSMKSMDKRLTEH